MNRILMDFWKWANITPEEYAIKGIPLTDEKAPFNYPLYDKLITYAERLLQNKKLTEEELSDFLTIMALDNETEDILDYATDNATEAQLQQILQYGMNFSQPEARWQLAELAYSESVQNTNSRSSTSRSTAPSGSVMIPLSCVRRKSATSSTLHSGVLSSGPNNESPYRSVYRLSV